MAEALGVNSMTGYGFSQFSDGEGHYRCEIKSVNSRYLEVQVRCPRVLLCLEPQIIAFIKSQVERGKIDAYIDLSPVDQGAKSNLLDGAEFDDYLDIFTAADKRIRHRGILTAPLDLQRLLLELKGDARQGGERGYTDQLEPDLVKARYERGVMNAVSRATAHLQRARAVEGAALRDSMAEPLGVVKAHLKELTSRLDEIKSNLKIQQKKRLEVAFEAAGMAADPSQIRSREDRLVLELAVLADKQDIAEEVTRLGVHIEQAEMLLGLSANRGPSAPKETQVLAHHSEPSKKTTSIGLGRKLDFICQEMFREINTMSSKLILIEVLERTVDMKQQVEKMRQQVQNIE